MTALERLVDAGSISRTVTEEVSYQKFSAQCLGRELRAADEANLLDEEDMHIFGLSPMTDHLDLVCCNACKKPIKASQYAAHAELCKFLSSRAVINLERDGPAVTRKPPRKERKKLQITQTRDTHLNSTHKLNGSTVNPYNVDSLKDVTKRSSKPLKRTAAENPSNPGIKNLCKTPAEVFPYVPAPLATKTYYSQRNHHLRSAISRMFFEEPGKESSNEVPCLEDLQVNVAPGQTSSPGVFRQERVACQQKF